MQVLAFVIFLFIAFTAGIVIVIRSFFLLVKEYKEKKLDRALKKGVATILIGIILTLLPTASFLLIRYSNSIGERNYVDTGTLIVWDPGQTSFHYKGEKYEEINLNLGNKDTVYWKESFQADRKIIFNIMSEISLIDRIFNVNEKENVYLVTNSTGFPIYSSYNLFTSEKYRLKVEAYYNDLNHYDFWLLPDGDENNRNISINRSEYGQLLTIANRKKTKKINLKNSSESFELYSISKDKVIEISGPCLIKYGDKWYMEGMTTDFDDDDLDLLTSVIELPNHITEKLNKRHGKTI